MVAIRPRPTYFRGLRDRQPKGVARGMRPGSSAAIRHSPAGIVTQLVSRPAASGRAPGTSSRPVRTPGPSTGSSQRPACRASCPRPAPHGRDPAQGPRRTGPRRPDHPRPRQHRRHARHLQRDLRLRDRCRVDPDCPDSRDTTAVRGRAMPSSGHNSALVHPTEAAQRRSLPFRAVPPAHTRSRLRAVRFRAVPPESSGGTVPPSARSSSPPRPPHAESGTGGGGWGDTMDLVSRPGAGRTVPTASPALGSCSPSGLDWPSLISPN